MPHLQQVVEENENVVVLAVHIAGDSDQVRKFRDQNEYTFPMLMDAKVDVATAYMVSGTPTTYFISKDGIFLGGVPGYMEPEYLNELVTRFAE